MSIGRLLTACGWTETPLTSKPFDHIEHTPGTGDVPRVVMDFDKGDYPVVTGDASGSAAYWLASRMEELFADAFPDVVRRPGDMMFSPDVLDQLAAAGCTVEERDDDSIIIHMPNIGGEIRADYALVQALGGSRKLEARELRREDMIFPIAGPRDVHTGPDYLKHDPTKRHSRRRPTTKRNRRR